MANKQLTAKVRLNTTQAEKSIDRLVKKINKIDSTLNKISTNNRVERQLVNSQRKVDGIVGKVRQWANAQRQVTSATKSTNSMLGSIGSKLRGIAATYLGLMGMRAIVNTTDLLVGAQNRLNYVNGGDEAATQDALDKMYASSQKVRTSYQGMMSNVSKTMTLAGDAFDNNIDNAIRFQEIMAEAYAVGGASAQEQASSMYQLTQALGAGVLAGDELRSVREGAPLAYQAIEEFAQGILKTDESLKDLAADGKITSDIVVAAIMNAGDKLDTAFNQTRQTFGQTFDQIKNSALYAFQPVMEMLTDMLNKAIDNGMIQRFESLFTYISKGILIVFKVIEIAFDVIQNCIDWIANNFDWLVRVVLTALTIIGVTMAVVLFPKFVAWLSYIAFVVYYYLWLAATSVMSALKVAAAWVIANWQLALMILVIVAIVTAIIWLADSFEDACGMIVGVVMAAVSVIWNLFLTLVTLIIQGAVVPLLTAWDTFANFFGNLFNDPIAAIIYAFEGLAQSVLGILKTIANGIDAIFGSNLSDAVSGWSDKLKGKADSLVAKYGNGSYNEKSNVTEEVNNLLSGLQTKFSWNTADAYNTGYEWGYSGASWIKDKVGGIGSGLDSIGSALGLDFSDMGSFPTEGVDGGYSPDVGKLLNGIGDDTGKIADSMDLTEEDLTYLRDLAEMEWKKEFTTANITVDMSNYNTINGENDLDGIVTRLSDKLYEEMNILADGVYA